MTLVIAHRGASAHAPENTLAAYELAVTQRADMIEIDLHRTRDGAIVVTHDERLEGLGGSGEIADATLAAVRALDAGDGERIPTLDEVLDLFGSRIPFNLELKRGTRQDYAGLPEATLEAVEARGLLSRTLFSSFGDPALGALRAASPGARIGVLVSARRAEGWLARAARVGAEAVHLSAILATRENVDRAHGEGLQVHVYTVDDEAHLRALIDLGVDGIFTNVPDRLRAILG